MSQNHDPATAQGKIGAVSGSSDQSMAAGMGQMMGQGNSIEAEQDAVEQRNGLDS